MELKIVYGVNTEIERVKRTLKELSWYREQGYTHFESNLPKQLTEQSSEAEIAGAISAVYEKGMYEDYAAYIREHWSEISQNLEKLKEIPGFDLREKYIIALTRYGSGGSYDSKQGSVTVNIGFRAKEQIVATISHEIVHIGIQHLIDKHKVRHWYKERLVDLIGNRYFPHLRKMQNIKEDVEAVDKAFATHFPDLEAITKEIGGE